MKVRSIMVGGLLANIVFVTSANSAEADGWTEKLTAQCSITTEGKNGEEIRAMLLEVKERIFDAAELRAKGILENKDYTDAEKVCAQTVISAIPALSSSQAVLATTEAHPQVASQGVPADEKSGNVQSAETASHSAPLATQPVAVSVPTAQRPLNEVEQSKGTSSDWLQWTQKNWDFLLAIYVSVLGAIIWRQRKGFDKPWKATLSKATIYILAAPVLVPALIVLGVLGLLWKHRQPLLRGALNGVMGGGSSSSGSASSSPSPFPSTSPTTDDTVNIEFQDLGGGGWKRLTTAPNNPSAIRSAFRNASNAVPGRKLRAVGVRTGQLYDMQ